MELVPSVTFDDIVAALDSAVVDVAATDRRARLARVVLIEREDLSSDLPPADLLLLAGVEPEEVRRTWSDGAPRPRAIVTRSPGVAAAAADLGIDVITVRSHARWDRVLGLVQSCLERGRIGQVAATADLDLFGLVSLIAEGTGGLVSVEDPTSSRVLAYSPSQGEADELRVLTILGRSGPAEYLSRLRGWGVFGAIARGGEVVDVPAHPELDMRRRLVVGVHDAAGRQLGSIWVQEGSRPLSSGASEVLLGASAVAARILVRELQAPTTEAQLTQRVFGEHGGIDPASAGAYLGIDPDSDFAVVGLTPAGGRLPGVEALAAVAGAIRLQASAFAPTAVTGVVGDAAYLLLPGSSRGLLRWVEGLVARFDGAAGLGGATLRAAVVSGVDGLGSAAAAREECDRVLRATGDGGERVTTLARSRTAVLLQEIRARLVGDGLDDPRFTALRDYDERHDAAFCVTLETWLSAQGNVRDAAAALDIHVNTLRYRLERIEQISGLDLGRADDRFVTQVQFLLDDA